MDKVQLIRIAEYLTTERLELFNKLLDISSVDGIFPEDIFRTVLAEYLSLARATDIFWDAVFTMKG